MHEGYRVAHIGSWCGARIRACIHLGLGVGGLEQVIRNGEHTAVCLDESHTQYRIKQKRAKMT